MNYIEISWYILQQLIHRKFELIKKEHKKFTTTTTPPKKQQTKNTAMVVMHINIESSISIPDGCHSCNDAIYDWYQLRIQTYQLIFKINLRTCIA